MTSLKLVHNDTVRRARIETSWEAVCEQAEQLHGVDLRTGSHVARYTDSEGDRVTLGASDVEVKEALADAARAGRVLRVTIAEAPAAPAAGAEPGTPREALHEILREFLGASACDREIEVTMPMWGGPQVARWAKGARACMDSVLADLEAAAAASATADEDEALKAAVEESLRSVSASSSSSSSSDGEAEDGDAGEEESKDFVESTEEAPRATVPDVAREAAAVARSRSASPVDDFQVVDAAASDDEGRAEVASPSESAYPIAHAVLQSLGMTDAAANERYLVDFEGDVDRTVSALMSS